MALNGIDIASHQERIDLTAVPCDFVIIKATQGTKYVNPDFRRAYEQAINAGKLVGVYHYASSGGAIAEADHFLDTIGTAVGRAILCLDWEKGDNDNFQNVAYAHKWLDYVRNKSGEDRNRNPDFNSSSCLPFFIFGAFHGIYGTVHTHNEYTSQQGDSFSHCRDYSRMHRPCGRGYAIGTGSRYLYCQERFICP